MTLGRIMASDCSPVGFFFLDFRLYCWVMHAEQQGSNEIIQRAIMNVLVYALF